MAVIVAPSSVIVATFVGGISIGGISIGGISIGGISIGGISMFSAVVAPSSVIVATFVGGISIGGISIGGVSIGGMFSAVVVPSAASSAPLSIPAGIVPATSPVMSAAPFKEATLSAASWHSLHGKHSTLCSSLGESHPFGQDFSHSGYTMEPSAIPGGVCVSGIPSLEPSAIPVSS